jgi:hypothetical protein
MVHCWYAEKLKQAIEARFYICRDIKFYKAKLPGTEGVLILDVLEEKLAEGADVTRLDWGNLLPATTAQFTIFTPWCRL